MDERPSPTVDESTLPPQMRRLVRLLGVADTMRLLKLRGGTVLELPAVGERSFLVELLGVEKLRSLIEAYEGQRRINLPKHDKITLQLRDREIRAALARGVSVPTVAVRYDLTTRQVQNISRDSEPKTVSEAQLGLPFAP